MKTTIEVSDDLYRRAKAEAALRGRKLKDLVAEGLAAGARNPTSNAWQSELGRSDEECARNSGFWSFRSGYES